MNNFKYLYKILKVMERTLYDESFDVFEIQHEALKISEKYWTELMIILAKNDYIEGVTVFSNLGVPEYVKLINPKITLKGLEYLEENSLMKKAAELVMGAVNIIK